MYIPAGHPASSYYSDLCVDANNEISVAVHARSTGEIKGRAMFQDLSKNRAVQALIEGLQTDNGPKLVGWMKDDDYYNKLYNEMLAVQDRYTSMPDALQQLAEVHDGRRLAENVTAVGEIKTIVVKRNSIRTSHHGPRRTRIQTTTVKVVDDIAPEKEEKVDIVNQEDGIADKEAQQSVQKDCMEVDEEVALDEIVDVQITVAAVADANVTSSHRLVEEQPQSGPTLSIIDSSTNTEVGFEDLAFTRMKLVEAQHQLNHTTFMVGEAEAKLEMTRRLLVDAESQYQQSLLARQKVNTDVLEMQTALGQDALRMASQAQTKNHELEARLATVETRLPKKRKQHPLAGEFLAPTIPGFRTLVPTRLDHNQGSAHSSRDVPGPNDFESGRALIFPSPEHLEAAPLFKVEQ